MLTTLSSLLVNNLTAPNHKTIEIFKMNATSINLYSQLFDIPAPVSLLGMI